MMRSSGKTGYIGNANGNATETARIGGYSCNNNVLGVTSLRLLRNPKIARLIEKRVESAVMPADESAEGAEHTCKNRMEH